MLFVDDDEAERFDGSERRRPGADDDARLASVNAPPFVAPFSGRQRAMEDGDLVTETAVEKSGEPGGERDLGNEHQNASALA